MLVRLFALTVFALALLPAASFAGDMSGDYGHATVGADNNDDAGDVQDQNNNGENDSAEQEPAAGRTAEDGRRPINSARENQGDYGND